MARDGYHKDYQSGYSEVDVPSDIVGKTIDRVEKRNSSVYFLFKDKTYLAIGIESYDDDDFRLDFCPATPFAYLALEIGLIDQAEYERSNAAYAARLAEREANRDEEDKRRRHELFKRLKAEFGEEV